MRLVFGAAVLALSTASLAGWTGGGGELVKDAANPWFIENTEVVKACIETDAEHFHLPVDKADLQHDFVEKALAYWQCELAGSRHPSSRAEGPLPVVGSQRFQFGPCAADTDLRFQFGALSSEQQKSMQAMGQDPREFTSVAVRTDYDQVNLRGRGFIYIAADSGPLKPSAPDLIDRPWARGAGGMLLKVLAHELGHVFGVPHTAATSATAQAIEDLMNGSYPEAVVTAPKGFIDLLAKPMIPHFFTAPPPQSAVSSCVPNLNAATLNFLGVAAVNCLALKRNGDIVEFIDVEAEGGFKPIGAATFAASRYRTNYEASIRLWLPSQQNVVKPWPDRPMPRTLPLYPRRSTLQQLGTYHNAQDTVTRTVILTSMPGVEWFTVGGQLASGTVAQIPFF